MYAEELNADAEKEEFKKGLYMALDDVMAYMREIKKKGRRLTKEEKAQFGMTDADTFRAEMQQWVEENEREDQKQNG